MPASWPVLNLSAQPDTCVRFDLHAVYLGTPGANQRCPSWLLGTTESILIQPGPRSAQRQSQENTVSNLITATAPGISVTATFDTDKAAIVSILTSAGLPAPGPAEPSGRGLATSAARIRTASSAGAALPPELPAGAGNDVGLGFDTCAAPSSAVMQAWLNSSPYRAIGIYIGGADRACDQVNLTAGWLQQLAAAGWHFIPMYAGPQAALGQLTDPAQQAIADANDAVAQAQQLGFGPGTPLYYDMEAYLPAQSAAALQFLSAWTTQVHKLGYASGVYASSDSGVANLAAQYGNGTYAVPDVIYDALWNGQANTTDGNLSSAQWPGGRRVHQFSGNVMQTFGGDTLLIDQDYLDVALPVPTAAPPDTGTTQASAAVLGPSGTVQVFFAGADHHLMTAWQTTSGHWASADLGGDLTSQPSAVEAGPGTVAVFYRGADDRLWEVTGTSAGWRPAERLSQMGPVEDPHAVAQPNGVIDVFWRGFGGIHLWHAQYNPATGWAGPQNLGGWIGGSPYPVETKSGQVQVFWAGRTYHNLWRVTRGSDGKWSVPQFLGMGRLGASPRAVLLPDGEVDVFWQDWASPYTIRYAVFRPGAAAAGPFVAVAGARDGQPWPVLAAGADLVLYRGKFAGLRDLVRAANGQWALPGPIAGAAALTSAPFAAVTTATGPLETFWRGPAGQLWTAAYTKAAGWTKPAAVVGTAS